MIDSDVNEYYLTRRSFRYAKLQDYKLYTEYFGKVIALSRNVSTMWLGCCRVTQHLMNVTLNGQGKRKTIVRIPPFDASLPVP